LVKLACAVDLAALLAFASILVYGFSNLSVFSERLDPWLRLVQLLFVIALLSTIAMLYASYRLWRSSGRGLWITIYTAGLVLAAFTFIWIVASSRIVQASLNY